MFLAKTISENNILAIIVFVFIFSFMYYAAHAIFFTLFNLFFGIRGRKNNSKIADFIYSIITLLMWSLSYLLVIQLPLIGFQLSYLTDVYSLYTVGTILIAFILVDFIEYWIHYVYHKIPLLWKFHRFHHNPKSLSWAKGMRLSIFESFGTSFLVNLFLLLIFGKIHLLFLSTLFAFKRFYGLFLHSNTDVDFGRVVIYLSSPRYHHWHHAAELHQPKNLCTLFPLWDKIFGTFYGEGSEMPSTYGTTEDEKEIVEDNSKGRYFF